MSSSPKTASVTTHVHHHHEPRPPRPSSSGSDSSGALTPYPSHARRWSLKAFLKIAYPRGGSGTAWDPRPLSHGLTPSSPRLSNASPTSTTPPSAAATSASASAAPKRPSRRPASLLHTNTTPILPSWLKRRVSHRKSASTATSPTTSTPPSPSKPSAPTTLPHLVDDPNPCGFWAMLRFLHDVLEQPSRQLDPFVRFLEYQSLVLVLQQNMTAASSPFADPDPEQPYNRADRSSKEATIAAAAKAVERGLEKCGLEIPPLVRETAERWSRQKWIGPVEAEAIWLMALLTVMTDHLRSEAVASGGGGGKLVKGETTVRADDRTWEAWGEPSRSGSLDLPEQDLISFL